MNPGFGLGSTDRRLCRVFKPRVQKMKIWMELFFAAATRSVFVGLKSGRVSEVFLGPTEPKSVSI